jgi:hypothetical protein
MQTRKVLTSQKLKYKRKERKRMLKNAIIALLASALLFTNTILGEYGWIPYIATSMVAFMVIVAVEMIVEDYMAKIRRWKKFNRTVNRKVALNQPTKVS